MVLAAVFTHRHAEAFFEHGFGVVDVAETAFLCQADRRDFGLLQHHCQNRQLSFRTSPLYTSAVF